MNIIKSYLKRKTNIKRHKDGFYVVLLVLVAVSANDSARANDEQANFDPVDIESYLEGLLGELEECQQNNTRLQEIVNECGERTKHLDIYTRLARLEHKVATLPSKGF